jgi:hypothetical protein
LEAFYGDEWDMKMIGMEIFMISIDFYGFDMIYVG